MMENGDIYIYKDNYYLKLKDRKRDVALGPVLSGANSAKEHGYPISTNKWSNGITSKDDCKAVFSLLDLLKKVSDNVY